jgi:hypothetical protein
VIALAVPEITPVLVLKLMPVGNVVGEIAYEIGVPPEFEGVIETVPPIVNVAGFGAYVKAEGITSLTVMERLAAEDVPPEFDAVTLKSWVAATVLAVPEITPVAELKLIPPGKVVGLIAYEVGVPPEFEGEMLTAPPFVKTAGFGV